MTSRPVLLWSMIAGGILLVLVALATPAELIARSQLASATAKIAATFPGVGVSPSGGLALWQFASGQVTVDVTLSEDALAKIAACRTDRDVSISVSPAGVLAETEQSFSGMAIPVGVLLVPRLSAGAWVLEPDSITAGGMSLPVQRAAGLLGDREGAIRTLLEGIRLPSNSSAAVTNVAVGEGVIRLAVAVPLRTPSASASGERIAALSECLSEETTR